VFPVEPRKLVVVGSWPDMERNTRLNVLASRVLARAGVPSFWDLAGPTDAGRRAYAGRWACTTSQRVILRLCMELYRGELAAVPQCTVRELVDLPRPALRLVVAFLKGWGRR